MKKDFLFQWHKSMVNLFTMGTSLYGEKWKSVTYKLETRYKEL